MKLVKSLLNSAIQCNLSGTVQYFIDTDHGVSVSESDAVMIVAKLGGNVSIVDAPVVTSSLSSVPSCLGRFMAQELFCTSSALARLNEKH